MSGFHESLDAALGRAGDGDARDDLIDAFYGSVSWDDLIDGRWTHDPRGLCGHLANLAAQRIEQAKAEERERIASAIEAESQRAHAAFASDEDDHLADMRNRLGVTLEPGHWNRHDDGCHMCGIGSAARIARTEAGS